MHNIFESNCQEGYIALFFLFEENQSFIIGWGIRITRRVHPPPLKMSDLLTQEEMNDIGLEPDQVNVLKKCFDGFADEDGAIPADNVGNILSMMGLKVKPSALKDIIEEIDEDGIIATSITTRSYGYKEFILFLY